MGVLFNVCVLSCASTRFVWLFLMMIGGVINPEPNSRRRWRIWFRGFLSLSSSIIISANRSVLEGWLIIWTYNDIRCQRLPAPCLLLERWTVLSKIFLSCQWVLFSMIRINFRRLDAQIRLLMDCLMMDVVKAHESVWILMSLGLLGCGAIFQAYDRVIDVLACSWQWFLECYGKPEETKRISAFDKGC